MPTIEEIRQLPCYWQQTIPSDYLDRMGHMNVQYYVGVYDRAADYLFNAFGMTAEYVDTHNNGAFALEQHIRYLAEVHGGDTVSVYFRLLDFVPKRVHFMGFMVNETQGKLAAVFESLGSHADLDLRRTTPFPPELAHNIGRILNECRQLEWEAPVCGSIHAQR